MIQWQVYINELDNSVCFDINQGDRIQIREVDRLLFTVRLSSEEFSTKGAPTIVVGDIPLLMIAENITNNEFTFTSSEPITSHKSKYFYNFFGESEVTLFFDNEYDSAVTATFDILARKENANMANEMLGFLTDNLVDAVAICFSRSKNGADLSGTEGYKFNKLDAISNAADFFSDSIINFSRDNKYILNSDMTLSEQGQPTGPDSIYWALTNLDKLSPASHNDVNIYFNNRGYYFEKQPKEIITKDTDVFENRVINTFLMQSELFLFDLINEYKINNFIEASIFDTEYVRFDHTMSKFSRIALDVKIKEIEKLINRVRGLRKIYLKIIPSKVRGVFLPKITSYVAKKTHYRNAFQHIEKYYKSHAPKFNNNKMLLGLKNLSIIYELTSLLILHKIIQEVFEVNVSMQNYRYHAEDLPFGGVDKERPSGVINNHFLFSSNEYQIELLYEAKIYPYSSSSQPGDFIDTSNTYGSSRYGKHHYCPDFIVKIYSKKWGRPFTLILDSKFKDLNSIKEYDINSLTNKYLLNIHCVGNDGRLLMSPVDMLIILFAHEKNGNLLRTVSPRHCITGKYPVLPQSTALVFHTRETELLKNHLIGLKNTMNSFSNYII
ncbi:UNVERIFIED_ORG: hypothetical protein M2402_003531 [Rahnella aquatilis]